MPEPTRSPNEAPPAARTAWWQKLLLLSAGLAMGLVLAELALRLTGAAPEVVLVQRGRFRLSPDPLIGYEPVPNFDYRGEMDSFHDYAGRSNSLGFRDRERAVEKEEGVFRILVLGDSVAAGQGVRHYEDTFPALVERTLLEEGLEAEVLNFAVTGYNTQQEVATLARKGLAYRPDLVLVAYCLNDRKRSDGGILPTLLEREKRARGLLSSRADPRLARSALYRFLRYRVADARRPTPPIYGDTVEPSFERLAGLSREHGFRVLVVIFPHFGKLLEEYRFTDEHAYVESLALRNGFYLLDLLPAFRECRRHEVGRLAHDRYHPTPLGHRCAAGAISGYLLEHHRALGAPG